MNGDLQDIERDTGCGDHFDNDEQKGTMMIQTNEPNVYTPKRGSWMEPEADGQWVRYEDWQKEREAREQAEAEVERMRPVVSAAEQWRESLGENVSDAARERDNLTTAVLNYQRRQPAPQVRYRYWTWKDGHSTDVWRFDGYKVTTSNGGMRWACAFEQNPWDETRLKEITESEARRILGWSEGTAGNVSSGSGDNTHCYWLNEQDYVYVTAEQLQSLRRLCAKVIEAARCHLRNSGADAGRYYSLFVTRMRDLLAVENDTLPPENSSLRGESGELPMDYSAAARVVHLYLTQFCDEKLAFPNMIAEAARKASEHIESWENLRRNWPDSESADDVAGHIEGWRHDYVVMPVRHARMLAGAYLNVRENPLCDQCGEELQREACNHVRPCPNCCQQSAKPAPPDGPFYDRRGNMYLLTGERRTPEAGEYQFLGDIPSHSIVHRRHDWDGHPSAKRWILRPVQQCQCRSEWEVVSGVANELRAIADGLRKQDAPDVQAMLYEWAADTVADIADERYEAKEPHTND